MMPEWLLQILSIAAGFGSVYGAIRADLKYLRRDVDLAHKRIDRVEGRTPITIEGL